jgi:hypothetical protein
MEGGPDSVSVSVPPFLLTNNAHNHAQRAKLTVTRFTPILTFSLEGEGIATLLPKGDGSLLSPLMGRDLYSSP